MAERESTRIAPEPISRFALWGNVVPLCLSSGFAVAAWNLAENGPARLAVFAALALANPWASTTTQRPDSAKLR